MAEIKCVRCNMHNVSLHGQICDVCNLNITFNKVPPEKMGESEKMEFYVHQRILAGCRECGNRDFGFNAGVKEEDGLKWYMMYVECPACNTEYVDVMEMDYEDVNSECE